ncbi:MAG: glycoside hydrolase family 78 protein [Prevotella sp.]|jgi:alpha-L-rhamnosidase|nr:glycoside hydrolase family 78 protein [Prevotella sp.]
MNKKIINKKLSWLFIILCFAVCPLSAGEVFSVEMLRIQYMKNPVGIDETSSIRFSWQLKSDERAISQKSYEIVVTSDEAGANTVWTSGVVDSDKNVGVSYSGPSLLPSTRYYWHVRVKDNSDREALSTETAFFETGLMNLGWSNAKWLKYEDAEKENKPDYSSVASHSINFDLKIDVTVVSSAVGVIFGAENTRNMHMWSINLQDQSYPLLRRHIYENNNPSAQDVSLQSFFTKADLLNKEVPLKIEVRDNVIKTYLKDILVDTHYSSTLKDGYFGFRSYKGGNILERAYIDNIRYITYEGGTPTVILEEDFENGSNDFVDVTTTNVGGNTKLDVCAVLGELRILNSESLGTPMFRTEFAVGKQVESARLYTSGLGVYDLFLNGKRVGHLQADGSTIYDELKPGWTDYKKTVFYSTHDVADLLADGQNALGAIVTGGWYEGDISHGEYGETKLGIIAKLIINYTDGTTETVVTDPSTWKTSKKSAIRYGDIYRGEFYDARMESAWTSATFDDSQWIQAKENNVFEGEIKPFAGPAIRVRPELNRTPQKITIYDGTTNTASTYGEINIVKEITGNKPISLKKGQTAIYYLGQNIVGWSRMKIKASSGTQIRVRYAEMLNDSGEKSRKNDNAKGTLYLQSLRGAKASLYYTAKGGGSEEFAPSMTFFGFQYCEVSATEDIEIESLVGEVVGSDTEERAAFSTSHQDLNKLYSNIRWGQRGNFLSIPTDCPQRDERLGWTGDTQIFVRTATYNADVAAFFRKWMGDMRDSQLESGAYPDVAPHAWVGYGNSAWAEAGIIVPWTVYLMYADKDIILENYASMEKYMDFLSQQAGNGYQYNGAGTAYGDWLAYETTGKRYVSVAYYAYAAQLMAKMSRAVSSSSGDIFDLNAQKYETLYENIKTEFNNRYINSDGSLTEKSQTAYLLALKLGLFPNGNAKNDAIAYLTNKIKTNNNTLSTGFVGTGILNQTISEFGATDIAYNLMLQRNDPSWLYSVDQGATTIWERWNSYTVKDGFNVPDMNSFNHYAYGAVSEWMFRFIAGIEADESNPGFRHIILQPKPDTRSTLPDGQERITYAEASFPSCQGIIKSAWELKADRLYTYKITVPANSTATLYLPRKSSKTVFYENDVKIENVQGVESVIEKDDHLVVSLLSGTYVFEEKGELDDDASLNTLTAINNSPNNGGYSFKDFKWFRNSI